MILPDLNLALYAHNTRDPRHLRASAYWEALLSGEGDVLLASAVLVGFVRLATSPKSVPNALSAARATALIDEWLARPNVRIPEPGPTHFETMGRLLSAVPSPSPLATDAHLAALALERGATLHSHDRDFARWPELDWRDPLA